MGLPLMRDRRDCLLFWVHVERASERWVRVVRAGKKRGCVSSRPEGVEPCFVCLLCEKHTGGYFLHSSGTQVERVTNTVSGSSKEIQ